RVRATTATTAATTTTVAAGHAAAAHVAEPVATRDRAARGTARGDGRAIHAARACRAVEAVLVPASRGLDVASVAVVREVHVVAGLAARAVRTTEQAGAR